MADWCGRASLASVALVTLCGCSTMDRNARLVDFASHDRTGQTNGSYASGLPKSATPDFKPEVLTLDPASEHGSDFSGFTPERQPLLRFVTEDSGAATPVAAPGPRKESVFSKDYWSLVGEDIKETFTAPAHWETRDWLLFGGVVAGIGTVAAFDEDIQKAVQRNRNGTVDVIFNAVEPFGEAYAAGVLGAFYVGGEIFGDSRAKAVALDGLSASIIASGLILQPLKYTVGRARPTANEGAYNFEPFGGHDSFPSGHATEAFAVATVIAEHYDSLWIKFSAYGLASMVGYARLNNNAHWASDVLTGAAIGTFVGHVVVHFNENHRNVSLQPVLGPKLQGAQLSFAF